MSSVAEWQANVLLSPSRLAIDFLATKFYCSFRSQYSPLNRLRSLQAGTASLPTTMWSCTEMPIHNVAFALRLRVSLSKAASTWTNVRPFAMRQFTVMK